MLLAVPCVIQSFDPENSGLLFFFWRKVPLFKKKLNLFIYLFLAALGLRCCTFSSCGERGLLFVAVRGLLIAVAYLVAEHGLQVRDLQ